MNPDISMEFFMRLLFSAIYAGTLDPVLDPQIQAAIAALNP